MRHSAFFLSLLSLTVLAVLPVRAQNFTFVSNGTGAFFSDDLTQKKPHPVDFKAVTSGLFQGKAATLTIQGFGAAAPTRTNDGFDFYTSAFLINSTVLLQDTATSKSLFSLSGPLDYLFTTSKSDPEVLKLSGVLVNSLGTPYVFNFMKDVGAISANADAAAVPEGSTALGFGLLAGFLALGMTASAFKRSLQRQGR